MPIHVHMHDFIRTADFGGVKLGMSRHELQELLGEPPDWSVIQRRKRPDNAVIWKYGSIEFYFAASTNVLYMIFSDHFPLEGCETLHLNAWILTEALPLEVALPLLDEATLKYQLTTDARLGATYVSFESGVRLNFHPPSYRPPYEDGPLELTGFSLSSGH